MNWKEKNERGKAYAGLLIRKYSTQAKNTIKRNENKILRRSVTLFNAVIFLKAAFIIWIFELFDN